MITAGQAVFAKASGFAKATPGRDAAQGQQCHPDFSGFCPPIRIGGLNNFFSSHAPAIFPDAIYLILPSETAILTQSTVWASAVLRGVTV